MIDLAAATLALRNRALSVVVATTGSTSLAATATGYTRASGSFVADLFVVGQELLASGFATAANNGYKVVIGVAAGTLTVTSLAGVTMAIEAAGGDETLTVGLPALRAYENTVLTLVPGRPYLTEEFIPATHALIEFPANGAQAEETGLYVLTWYGLVAAGTIPGVGISALRKSVDALKLLFAPGTKLPAGSNTVCVRSDTATRTGQIIPLNGWAALQLTIPWRASSLNAIAA